MNEKISYENNREEFGYLIMCIAAIIAALSIIGIFIGFMLGTVSHIDSIIVLLFTSCFLMIMGRIVEN